MELGDGECDVRRLEEILPDIDSRYYRMFFGDAGWRTKVAVVVVQGSLRMVFNLYFVLGECRSFAEPLRRDLKSLYRLVGKMLAAHFQQRTAVGAPFPLAVLSERERQVCMGILDGKKAELIAGEIGIGASSVVTYRQRAYQKLGISSRGQLFSICRG